MRSRNEARNRNIGMHCQILVPGLIGPAAGEGAPPPRAEGLGTPLARGRPQLGGAAGAATWLLESFGVARQRDWPVAPLALLGEGGAPGADYWMRADPAHLRLHRDRLLLTDAGTFRLAHEEA